MAQMNTVPAHLAYWRELHHSAGTRTRRVRKHRSDRGGTLLVIEPHPAVIAAADWVIELDPEGGQGGGFVIAGGTRADVAKLDTPTGLVMREQAANPMSRSRS